MVAQKRKLGRVELRTHERIADIGKENWDRLTGDDPPPFLSFEWLDALEQAGCVRPERGWLPLHITLHHDDELIAAAPAYVKGNSEGEFVFDHAWARFCHDAVGRDYYPKLIVAVPFTPATGKRVLIAPGSDEELVYEAFAGGLAGLVERIGVSSAHVLFPETPQAEALQQVGLLRRAGIQYHWSNPGYQSFDDFLGRFSSKKRAQVRRERREMEKQGIELVSLSGSDIDDQALEAMYGFYLSTVNKFFYGRQYLNRGFFYEVKSRMANKLHLVLAKAEGRYIGGAFNLEGGGALYGRYWGCTEERNFLHFNVCYYHGIEHAIAQGLSLFEPGAGGEHKLVRGFEPTQTHSVHYLHEPRLRGPVADFVARELRAIEQHLEEERRCGVLRPLPDTATESGKG